MDLQVQTRARKRRKQRGPTVTDVAREAGVSAMTVSRVINGDAHVQDKTRERVQAAVATLGYVPNQAARSLAGGRHCRIALLHSNPSAAYLSEFLVGSLAGASEADAQLVVVPWSDGSCASALVAELVNDRVDAVLLPPPLCDDPELTAGLSAAGLAMTQIGTGHPMAGAFSVTICDQDAAFAMTAHLLGLGHRRIGFIIGNDGLAASALRLAGYRRALSEAGIKADDSLIVQGDFSYRSGLAAAEELLRLDPLPTAIFASNDDMAAAVVAVCHRRGLNVPADISVCGFDDTAMATTIWPELTTIRQPVADMAQKAVQLLVARVMGDERLPHGGVDRLQLDFELVRRASDGPPGTGSMQAGA